MRKHMIFRALALIASIGMPFCPADEVPSGTDYSTLNSGDAEQNYRHREFRAYMPLHEVRRRAKISNYSSFENPTGIFFAEGEKVLITLSPEAAGKRIKLIVHDFGKDGQHSEYALTDGENELTIKNRGLAYIDYRADDPTTAPVVTADIIGGKINGVFTQYDNSATWKRLLNEAKCDILDILGERCQLTYDVNGLKKGCPNSGPDLVETYDEIIRMEQEDILGWHLDHVHPGNHIHGRVQWSGFMHADGLGAAFIYDAIPGLTNIEGLLKGSWGVAHEFGHVNQTQPAMMWVGTTEVTNNIFSSWVNFKLNPEDMRLEHEVISNADNVSMRGGRFDCYVNNAIVRRRLWQYHGGPDDGNIQAPGDSTGDHFVSVCPLWQLQLYLSVARGKDSFYPQIFREARARNDQGRSNGELRVLFFTRACDAAKLNLTEFFVKVGILAPMDRWVTDYGSAMMTITKEMCADAIKYASRYPLPDSSVIYYITANSVGIFRDRLAVIAPPEGAPQPSIVDGRMEMPADSWQNAVAFEAYKGNKLLRISLRGLNHADNSSTTIICPPGTTTVKAVQWDGKRFTVYSAPQK